MNLDHVNLRCAKPEAMVDFLTRLGCVSKGHRPAFKNHGYWLYDQSDVAVIHVSALTEPEQINRSENSASVAVVDHVAFRVAETEEQLKARLNSLEIAFTQRANPLAGVTQVLVQAPEGLTIELLIPNESQQL